LNPLGALIADAAAEQKLMAAMPNWGVLRAARFVIALPRAVCDRRAVLCGA
jgi:hypothetical protein